MGTEVLRRRGGKKKLVVKKARTSGRKVLSPSVHAAVQRVKPRSLDERLMDLLRNAQRVPSDGG